MPYKPQHPPTITISAMDFENQGPVRPKRFYMAIMSKRSSRNLLVLVGLLTILYFVSSSWSNPDIRPPSKFQQQIYAPPLHDTADASTKSPASGQDQHAEQPSSPEPVTPPQTVSNFADLSDAITVLGANGDKLANATIGKVTMLYGDSNPVYERALESHIEHGRKHNYPVHILRQKLLGRLWSKPAYILSIILNELQKPQDKRLEWLFWFDADTVLVNPKIPLEIFLPPSPAFDHIHFLCGNDHNGLNDGAFLLRINDYSMHLMAAALSVEGFRPEVSLKYSEQSAIEHVVHSGDLVRPWEDFSYTDGYAQIPQRWMNAYMGPRYEDGKLKPKKQITGNSIKEGDMLLHFAGSGETKRKRMTTFMNVLDKDSSAWEVEPVDTEYSDEISSFWRQFAKEEQERFKQEEEKKERDRAAHEQAMAGEKASIKIGTDESHNTGQEDAKPQSEEITSSKEGKDEDEEEEDHSNEPTEVPEEKGHQLGKRDEETQPSEHEEEKPQRLIAEPVHQMIRAGKIRRDATTRSKKMLVKRLGL